MSVENDFLLTVKIPILKKTLRNTSSETNSYLQQKKYASKWYPRQQSISTVKQRQQKQKLQSQPIYLKNDTCFSFSFLADLAHLQIFYTPFNLQELEKYIFAT